MASTPPSQSLSDEINAGTRAAHAQLNRLITSRLPLCLPPHSSTPQTYAAGLQHFAHIYLTFESLWHDLTTRETQSCLLQSLLDDPWVAVQQPDPTVSASTTKIADLPPTTNPQTIAFLANLRPVGLARSKRLRADLAALTYSTPSDASVHFARFPGASVQDYCTHIRRVVAQRPHVLVAYAWCYYMAVFSGGRWIRSQLRNAGEQFWASGNGVGGTASSSDPEKTEANSHGMGAGLSFFHFPGDQDGEDIKKEFKRRLEEADTIFTPEERREIVAEAAEIFQRSEALVQELDVILGTPIESLSTSTKADGITKSNSSLAGSAMAHAPKAATHQQYSTAGLTVILAFVAFYAVHYFSVGGVLPVVSFGNF